MGRPKLHNEHQVLAAAMAVFWRKGFKGTSTENLCQATQLKPGSIYHRYNDKASLFSQCLQFYIETIVGTRVAEMLSSEKPIKGIEYFFTSTFESVPAKELAGCLLTNTALEDCLNEGNVDNVVKKGLYKIELAFKEQIARALERDDLSEYIEPAETAIYLVSCFQGLMVSSRLTKNKKRLRIITHQTMQALGTNKQVGMS